MFNQIVGEPHSGGLSSRSPRSSKTRRTWPPSPRTTWRVGFKLDYVKADGDLSNYTPDFIVRTTDGTVWIVETKGREELDLPQKMARLRQWWATRPRRAQATTGSRYRFVYVDQESFEQHPPTVVRGDSRAAFTEYQRADHGTPSRETPYELSDAEKRDLIKLISKGKPLPRRYRFLLFEDKREVELVWNGKTREVCTAVSCLSRR